MLYVICYICMIHAICCMSCYSGVILLVSWCRRRFFPLAARRVVFAAQLAAMPRKFLCPIVSSSDTISCYICSKDFSTYEKLIRHFKGDTHKFTTKDMQGHYVGLLTQGVPRLYRKYQLMFLKLLQ